MKKNKRYLGGKSQDGVYQKIINQIPPHDIYTEPFLGMGGIMRNKKPAKQNIGIDLNNDVLLECKNKLHADFLKSVPVGFDFLNECGVNYLKYLLAKSQIKLNFENVYNFNNQFIYCDPPYLPETRTSNAKYKHELTFNDHIEILHILKQLPCKIAISTYPNDLYKEMLKDWRIFEYTSVASNGEVRNEWLMCNYPEPVFLHDDSYIGRNNEKRRDIKKRINRNKDKILKWHTLERVRFINELLNELSSEELNQLGVNKRGNRN